MSATPRPRASVRAARADLVVALATILVVRSASAVAPSPPPGSTRPAVSAADRDAALVLVREGNHLLDTGDAAAALEKFRAALRRVGGDKLRFNIGQALAAMRGREKEAFLELNLFLERVPGAAPDLLKAARDEIARLRPRLGFVRVQATPAGAAIQIDGEAVGLSPLERPVVVAPGDHVVEVAASGFTSQRATFTVAAGEERLETLVLAPAPRAPVAVRSPDLSIPPAAAVRAPAPVTSGTATIAVSAAPPPAAVTETRTPFYRRWWFWAAVGAVVIGTASIVAVTRGNGGAATHACPADIPASQCFSYP